MRCVKRKSELAGSAANEAEQRMVNKTIMTLLILPAGIIPFKVVDAVLGVIEHSLFFRNNSVFNLNKINSKQKFFYQEMFLADRASTDIAIMNLNSFCP